MALARCDVHEAAFGDEVGPLASRERVFVDELADSPLALRGFRQIGFRDFVVEMARVREDTPSFIAGKCAAVTISLQPVAETMKSASRTALRMGRTSNPSMEASIAFTESTSVTTTRAPIPRARIAIPRPVHP